VLPATANWRGTSKQRGTEPPKEYGEGVSPSPQQWGWEGSVPLPYKKSYMPEGLSDAEPSVKAKEN